MRGIVFGTWAEASVDVSWLLSCAADTGTIRQRRARSIDGDDDDVGRGSLIGMLIRRWGMAALCANALLLLDRLQHVGWGAAGPRFFCRTISVFFGLCFLFPPDPVLWF